VFLAAGCTVLGLLAGCASEPDSHLVSAPPPSLQQPATTMTTTTTTSPVAVVAPVYAGSVPVAPVVSTVVVTQGPPALRQEVVLAQPSPQHVWIPGYWTWRDNEYQWMAGHWELPPSSGSVWVAPRWVQEGNAFRFYEGYWS
jgi:hypothetical protein